MNIVTLRRYARRRAEIRGHDMLRFKGDSNKQSSTCLFCRMTMVVIKDPTPYEMFVSGEAITFCCKRKEKK